MLAFLKKLIVVTLIAMSPVASTYASYTFSSDGCILWDLGDEVIEVTIDAYNETADFVCDAWDTTEEAVTDAWDDTTDAVGDAWDDTTDAVDDAIDTVGGWF